MSINQSILEEKINVVLHFLQQERDRRITVQEVCRLAGVSRSSLYEYHPDLVLLIRSKSSSKASPERKSKQHDLVQEVKRLSAANEALMLVCLEQRMVIDSLNEQIRRGKRRNTFI